MNEAKTQIQTQALDLTDVAKSPNNPEILIPQAIVQPPEYFISTSTELVNKNIENIITVGKWEIVTGEDIMVIDNSGKIYLPPENLNISPPNTKSIIEAALKEGKQFIAWGGSYSRDNNVFLQETIKRLYPSLGAKETEEIINNINTILKKSDISSSSRTDKFVSSTAVKNNIEIFNEKKIPPKIYPAGNDGFIAVKPNGEIVKITVTEKLEDWKTENISMSQSETVSEEVTAQELKIKIYQDKKSRIVDTNGQQLMVLPDQNPVLDPEDKSTIWFINNGKLNSLNCKKVVSGNLEFSELTLPEGIDNCESVNIDPNGNFLVITHTDDNDKKIAFIDKNNLSLIEEVEEVGKAPVIDQDGNVIFIDNKQQLRVVTNNFKHFSIGEGSKIAEIQERKMEALRSQVVNLVMPEVSLETATQAFIENETSALNTVEGIMSELNQKLETMFMPQIEAATSEVEIQKLLLQLQAIKNKPEFQQYPVVSEGIERAMEIKTNQFRAMKLEAGLASINTQIPIINSLEGSLSLVKEMERIQLLRGEVNLMLLDPEKAKIIQQQIKQLEAQVTTIQQSFQGELVAQLQSGLTEVGNILGSAETLMELEEAGKDPLIHQFKERLNLVSDPKQRAELRRQWAVLMEKRQQEIGSKGFAKEQDKQARLSEIATEIDLSFKALNNSIEGLIKESNGKINLNAWKESSQTVADLREQIKSLPNEYQQGYLNKIEELILKKQKEHQQKSASEKENTVTKGATIKFGKENFPIYQIPLMTTTPEWFPETWNKTTKDDWGHLAFKSTNGEIWRTGETMIMNLDDPVQNIRIEELRKIAQERFNPKRRVPRLPSEMVLTPSQEKTLETMTRLFRIQLGLNRNLVREREPRGITIMQGDAGVGKDFSIEIFASLTNREIVSVPCRFSMDPEDITSEYRFNPKKGTFRVPSQFAQALSKPGTIINFIEINTMPPEVSKMLNSVFDFKRTLFFTQGEDTDSVELNVEGIGKEIKVNEDVIFVGTMNPENYVGTRPLPQEFKSRARFMDVDYPPYRVAINANGKQERVSVEQTSIPDGFVGIKVLPDEAMILAKQVDSLRTLTSDEFSKLWDHKINREAGNGADMFDNPERSKAIEDLNQIVIIANKMRQAYRAYQTGEPGAEIFEFVFSLRESQDIVAELAESGSVKEAVAEVVLPKISNSAQKRLARAIIETS